MQSSRASVLSLLLIALLLESASAEVPLFHWQRSTLFPGLGEPSALAFDPGTGRLAVGDEQGVWLSGGAPAAARVLRRGPVRDLAFSPDAGLYAATDRGLYHLDGAGDVSERSLGAGAGAVRRILVTPEFVLAATEGGTFFSKEGWSWARLDAGLSAGAVEALAVRPLPDGADLWLIVRGALQRATLRTGAGRLTVEDVVQVPIAGGAGRRDALDLSTSFPGAEVAVLTRRGLSLCSQGSWESFRPAFPPGAEPLRFGHAASRLWIATDRGLLEAVSPSGPWHRVAPPVGNTPIAVVAGGQALIYAAGVRGLFTGRPRSDAPEPVATLPPSKTPWVDEPSVQQVQVAATRYLDLGPERIRALRRGLRRRGWLPRFELRGSYGGGRSRQRDYDEAFTYDAPRRFLDRERERSRDFALSTALVWELGDLAYHPESIDVSKEAREIIELRDDVLDEITQLYFERRRTLLQLASQSSARGAEAARLRLRADELGSGLDAWTGGWWSRAASAPAAHSPLRTPEEIHP
jgi:hypothetical protein